MNDFIDFGITVSKDHARFRIGEEEYLEVPHHLQEKLPEFQSLERTHEYGMELLDSLLPALDHNQFRWLFNRGIEEEGKNFHFRINIQDPELETLYWESIQDRDSGKIFGRHSNIFLSRTTSFEDTAPQPVQVDKIRVLVVISSALNGHKEASVFQELNQSQGKDLAFTILQGPARVENIKTCLENGCREPGQEGEPFTVLYVISAGYSGDQGACLLLETGNDGRAVPLDAAELGKAIQPFNLKLVLISAGQDSADQSPDYTLSAASAMIKSGVAASIALRGGMDQKAVQLFISHFFSQMVSSQKEILNKPVDQLVNEARHEIWFRINRSLGGKDWLKPVLFMRGAGFLFQTQPIRSSPEGRKVKNMLRGEDTDSSSEKRMAENGVVVFCSYAHEDAEHLDKIMLKLAPYIRKGLIQRIFRDSEKIKAGDDWEKIIDKALEEAELVLLLLSEYFFSSDFIVDKEFPKVDEKRKAGEAVLIPIIIRKVDWKEFRDLGELQALPRGEDPVVGIHYSKMDQVLFDIANSIKEKILEIRKNKEVKKFTRDGASPVKSRTISNPEMASGPNEYGPFSKAQAFKLLRRFDEAELESFCDRILVDYESLAGKSRDLEAKARALVLKCFDNEELRDSFLEELKKKFPND